MTEPWTPYALEPIRRRLLWRRRVLAFLVALLLVALLLAFLLTRPEQVVETRISLSGGDGGGTVDIDVVTEGDLRSKPLTVSLSPGGVTLVGNDDTSAPDRLSKANTDYPFIRGERPIDFMRLLLSWGPLFLLAYLVWSAGRGATNPIAEVNFGIYKGAMPLEMVTESYKHLVVTQRAAEGPIFGKEREDYLPESARAPARLEVVRRR